MPARKRTKSKHSLKKTLQVFKQQLRAHAEKHGSKALSAFATLVGSGCSSKWLMRLLINLQLAHGFEAQVHGDTARMDSRRLRTIIEKTRWVAREWEEQFQHPFGRAVLQWAARARPHSTKIEYVNLPEKLMLLATAVREIHEGSGRSRRPQYDNALAGLTEYVRLKSNTYHDSEVCALIWFATGQRYEENHLRVFRAEHGRACQRARTRLLAH
jgi:hypothetical protein